MEKNTKKFYIEKPITSNSIIWSLVLQRKKTADDISLQKEIEGTQK